MQGLKFDTKTLRKFGFTMGIAFLAVSMVILIRHKHSALAVSSISGIFFLFSFLAPNLLKPLYIFWMKFAFVLNWINTRLILVVLFYLVFTPIGVLLRLLRVDLLDRRIEKGKGSYWKEREDKVFNRADYERQF